MMDRRHWRAYVALVAALGLIPIACAFGSLTIGTNQVIGLLIDN